ncbi:MAG: SCO family protein [Gloeobacteraceae cyanobacterium ES-bin-316]|nr:SCO family protein [Ferruginibacter sp.]
MPPHYFYDNITTTERRGKTIPDTIWHQAKNLSFTNQMGKKVSLDDARGKVLVINFFFTRCPSICPGLTRSMKKLQESFAKNPEIVQFISMSVDPEYDSVHRLRKYADKFEANHDNWWFVTGDKKEIYDFAFTEIKANIADVDVDTAFVHTENFFLLDSNRVLRGWYNGFDTLKMAQLAGDIPTLMLERDRKSPSIFREFIPILPLIFIGIAMVLIITLMLNRRRKNSLIK